MGMWPFRRKSNRKRLQASGANIPPPEGDFMHHGAAGTLRDGLYPTEMTSSGPERRRSRRDSRGKRRSSRDSKKLQRGADKQRKYSFSPGRNDTIRVARDVHHQPPVPQVPATFTSSAVRSKTTTKPIAINRPQIRSSTQPDMSQHDEWQRVPTLHKRTGQDLSWRRSSKKRRKEEHDREAEIKAMASSMPTRPATDSSGSGRPLKRESKRMRTGLNLSLHNPSSDISLPTAESMHSSLSSRSNDSMSYRLSAFDMLAPRPTIRYSESPRYIPGASGFGSSTTPRKARLSDRIQIPEETLKANKRVEELADGLDAGDIRELMERDQRRREKKKVAEKLKMERKLTRRQERQKAAETEAESSGTTPPANMERGVLGREVVGLGIGTSAVVTSSKRKGSNASFDGRGKRPAEIYRQDSEQSGITPHAHFQHADNLATEQNPSTRPEEAVPESAQVGEVSKTNVSVPPSPKSPTRRTSNISEIMDLESSQSAASVKLALGRRTSESPVRPPQSWTSFFKRRSRTPKRGSTPSSFSNTSRDSMQRDSLNSAASAQVSMSSYTPIKFASNVPKRTMSKFREHLPELPISPPDSRVQSPEADEVPPIRTDYPKAGHGSYENDQRLRHDTPTSGYQISDAMRVHAETPTSGRRSTQTVSPEPTALMSQSLASIDSEGSWLSGRKSGSKRGSLQVMTNPLRDSASSLQRRYREFSESAEELGIAEDEYFSRLTPGAEDQFKMGEQSDHSGGRPMASSDEEDIESPSSKVPETKWAAVARRPTVVHHDSRAKSREVNLSEYLEEGSSPIGETPEELRRTSYEMGDDTEFKRATSVDLSRGHFRRISAGSARLLDLKPTLGGESSKRNSQKLTSA
ncbi:hypothetical protein PVAG01_08249 [Phlyctema vagabunda]|uniref:Uncharacterized protein n=1 Tax=Phlyctema vagabunda TaxID=108571 RepID=A0ABR4P9K4_9HELO